MVASFNSTDVHRSRYVQGGTTERYPTRLGWWSRKPMSKSDTDITITINNRYHQRPWLVAADVYGADNLEWVILQYNCILDVVEEFVMGKVITIPTPQRLNLEILSNQAGGKRMTE